jgi:putative tryptophan/tyrosine transport system substrate-binding protein
MRRRDFIKVIAVAAAGWPLGAQAQTPVIGFLNDGLPDSFGSRLQAFREGLKELGYVERQSVEIEFRWAEGHYDRLPAMAADLARRQVAVIAASATPAALAAKRATSTIPIVFAIGGDPVKFELVNSVARPDGNVTGVYFFTAALAQKKLGLLHELVAKGALIGFLANPSNPNSEQDTEDAQAAAEQLGHKLITAKANTVAEIDMAFTTFVQANVGGLVVDPDGFFHARRVQITTLAARHGIPAVHPNSESVTIGGLMSYASSALDAYRGMGNYTARVLKGAKLSDLPVLQPTKLELVINLSTAKALGLTIPPGVLAIADEVIE